MLSIVIRSVDNANRSSSLPWQAWFRSHYTHFSHFLQQREWLRHRGAVFMFLRISNSPSSSSHAAASVRLDRFVRASRRRCKSSLHSHHRRWCNHTTSRWSSAGTHLSNIATTFLRWSTSPLLARSTLFIIILSIYYHINSLICRELSGFSDKSLRF